MTSISGSILTDTCILLSNVRYVATGIKPEP